jgi:hypothetical protein
VSATLSEASMYLVPPFVVRFPKISGRMPFGHINTNSDSEILLNVFAGELGKLEKQRINEKDIFTSITQVHKRVRGAYAAVKIQGEYLLALAHCCVKILPCLSITMASPGVISRVIS